jgi:hypothetical protein
LKTVVCSQRVEGVVPLIPHPKTELGNVFHKLLEMSLKGDIRRSGNFEEDVAETLRELLDAAQRKFSEDPLRCSHADLTKTMSPLDWDRAKRMFSDIAVDLLEIGRRHGAGSSGKGRLHYDDLPEIGRWSEVDIAVPRFRLQGRMDVVEKDFETVLLKDFKTGRIKDSKGQILDHIVSQMLLYGLMVMELDGGRKRIRLLLERENQEEIPFDKSTVETTISRLDVVLGKLPAGTKVEAASLADTGESCRYCSIRHVCDSYLSETPAKWKSGAEHVLPKDVWGTVKEINLRPDLNILTIHDVAGRTVKVFGLRDSLVSGVCVGERVYMFSLSAKTFLNPDGLKRHPLNFFENDLNDPWGRAWAAQLFRA